MATVTLPTIGTYRTPGIFCQKKQRERARGGGGGWGMAPGKTQENRQTEEYFRGKKTADAVCKVVNYCQNYLHKTGEASAGISAK